MRKMQKSIYSIGKNYLVKLKKSILVRNLLKRCILILTAIIKFIKSILQDNDIIFIIYT